MSYSSFTRGEFTRLHSSHAPRGVVTHIAGVIDFAVEQFGAQRHALVFGQALDVVQEEHAVLETFFVRKPLPATGQHDHVRSPSGRRGLDDLPHSLVDGRVVLFVVNPILNAAAAGNHRGDQRVFLEERKRLRPNQVDTVSSQPGRLAAFALELQFGALEYPAAHSLFEASFTGSRPDG